MTMNRQDLSLSNEELIEQLRTELMCNIANDETYNEIREKIATAKKELSKSFSIPENELEVFCELIWDEAEYERTYVIRRILKCLSDHG